MSDLQYMICAAVLVVFALVLLIGKPIMRKKTNFTGFSALMFTHGWYFIFIYAVLLAVHYYKGR